MYSDCDWLVSVSNTGGMHAQLKLNEPHLYIQPLFHIKIMRATAKFNP